MKTYVLDTNVLLYSAQALESFEDNRVVIPMAVIEELDKFKKHQDELGRNARQVIRRLDELRKKGSLFKGVPLDNGNGKPAGTLQVIAGSGPVVEGMDMSQPDNRILRVAFQLHKADPDAVVILISKDINLRLKADSLGIAVEDFERQRVNFDELFTGEREVNVPASAIDEFYKNGFLEMEDTLYPNEFAILRDETKRSALGWKRGKRIEAIPHEYSDKAWNITPRSKEQRMALAILMDPSIQVATLVGQAGSGKTLLALAAALECTLQRNQFDRILVSRPIVPMGNDLGYLPGSKDEKLDVWMQPIYDNLEYLLRNDKHDIQVVRRQIDELKRTRKLELEALTYIRGRSIPKQFVIVDEAQNLTPHEVKTIVSRAGEGTKMILTGDPYQIDNVYLDSCSNGLSYIVDRFKGLPLHGHITLRKRPPPNFSESGSCGREGGKPWQIRIGSRYWKKRLKLWNILRRIRERSAAPSFRRRSEYRRRPVTALSRHLRKGDGWKPSAETATIWHGISAGWCRRSGLIHGVTGNSSRCSAGLPSGSVIR